MDHLSAAPERGFVIRLATVNGSGSFSSNTVLLRSLFRTGVMVSGKNLFPSNIAGLPTWFSIRVSPTGHFAPRRDHQLVVCLTPSTLDDDLGLLAPGGVAFIDEKARPTIDRDDITIHRVPFQKLVRAVCPNARLRRMVVNMIYVGVLGHFLEIAADDLRASLELVFASKPKAVALNAEAIAAGREWAAEHLPADPRFVVSPAEHTKDRLLVEGNFAGAAGAVFGGVQVAAWYPITPSSSFADALGSMLARFRTDDDGATFAVVQAEDEIAAAGMVVGAGWAGARSITATSGPGISLMSEYIGLAYFAEVPGVFVNVQRMGPSTGMPTRTAQSDMLSLATLSHGDTSHPILIPADPKEYFDMMAGSFDLAERLQTPVFVAADLDLGMNTWVSEPFTYPETAIDRGKVLSAEQLDAMESFGRYRDPDGDGIPERTIPGTGSDKAGYFLRGSGHDENARYTESPVVYTRNLDRLASKLEKNLGLLPQPVVSPGKEKTAVIAYGTSHCAVAEALEEFRGEGREIPYLRLRSWPANGEVESFLAAHDTIHVVEQNRDGQMAGMLAARYPELAPRLRSLLSYDGWPLTVETVRDGLET